MMDYRDEMLPPSDRFEGVPDDVLDDHRRERDKTPFRQAYAEYQDSGVWPEDWDEDDEEADDEC
jgi:hypothetical protein